MSIHASRGKNLFIKSLASEHLNRPVAFITDRQYAAAKALYLAMAYDAFPEVIETFTKQLRNS